MKQVGIAHVHQKHRFGCAPAVMSMVTGVPYDEIISELGNPDEKRGFTFHSVDEWLTERGYAVSRLWRVKRGNIPRDPWPPEPWTDVHLVQVDIESGNHFIIWMRDGSVLDPNIPAPTTLANPAYLKINQIAGVHKI